MHKQPIALITTIITIITYSSLSSLLANDPPLISDDNQANQHKDQMREAYRKTKTYKASQQLSVQRLVNKWEMTMEGDASVAFDRDGSRMLYSQPDLQLVCDEETLRYRLGQIPDHHVEVAVASPLVYADVLAKTDVLLRLMPPDLPPDLILLLDADDERLAHAPVRSMSKKDFRDDQIGLIFDSDHGAMSLWLDAASHLITRARIEIDASIYGEPYGEMIVFQYDIEVQQHDQPLQKNTFAFNTTNSTAAGSFQTMVTNATPQMTDPQDGDGGGRGGSADGHPLQDQPAPAIVLNTIEGQPFVLDDIQEKVILLDFWATWCAPCRKGLPEIQKVHDWAKKSGRSVAVYTVNLQDPPAEAMRFRDDAGLTIPVLMDTSARVGRAYGVKTIPQTVLIKDGTVRHVHTSLLPNMEKILRDQIEELLKSDQ